MSIETFDIVFRGDIQFGQNLVDVKARLQQLFKIDAVKTDALFTGKPVVLKRGLDETTAEKYRDVLTKAGALVELVTSRTPEPVPVEGKKSDAKTESPAASNSVTGQWTLAPVGSILSPLSARLAPANRSFDLSIYTLRPVGGNLLDQSEAPEQPTAVLFVPEYKVADVGSNLIEVSERNELPLLEIDVEDWGLSEVGAPLLAESERKPDLPSPVADVDFSLAPVGSLLEQIKTNREIKIPDTSKLKIME